MIVLTEFKTNSPETKPAKFSLAVTFKTEDVIICCLVRAVALFKERW
jgi:hypothetical protein